MPLPLAPVIAALCAGGSLVPHAAGGFIVTAASGYVAGTYLSTTAIISILTIATASAGGIAAALTGGAAALWGSAGLFGTTIGATGIKGMLMSAGLISSTPVWIPAAAGGALVTGIGGTGYLLYHINRLKKKGEGLMPGQEAQFTERDAKLVEKILLALHKRGSLPE
ncbi:hypothetical protein ABC383_17735 [Noviherbaspirillum sp. 1P10PC]|uniref:hypothetical protein n=1 Tax=Noviherbaspirillum sp. 1P10PC TaxID=3132292 RepID=UPI0039A23E76